MAGISTTTQYANRYGLNLGIYALTDTAMASPLVTIDFANQCTYDLSGDRVWATGGQDHANKVAFNNPLNGTLTISTQLMTSELLNVIAGGTAGSATNTIEFKNSANTAPKYYIIKAETVWQDADGNTYSETIVAHKASPQRAYNISYSGDGDPTSVDIVFDLLQDSAGKLLTVTKADQA